MLNLHLLAQRLKNERVSHKETQDEIGKLLNVGRSTICEYERGTINPPVKKLKILSEHWNVPIEYLIGKPDLQLFCDVPEDIKFVLSDMIKRLKSNQERFMYDGYDVDDRIRNILIGSISTAISLIDGTK